MGEPFSQIGRVVVNKLFAKLVLAVSGAGKFRIQNFKRGTHKGASAFWVVLMIPIKDVALGSKRMGGDNSNRRSVIVLAAGRMDRVAGLASKQGLLLGIGLTGGSLAAQSDGDCTVRDDSCFGSKSTSTRVPWAAARPPIWWRRHVRCLIELRRTVRRRAMQVETQDREHGHGPYAYFFKVGTSLLGLKIRKTDPKAGASELSSDVEYLRTISGPYRDNCQRLGGRHGRRHGLGSGPWVARFANTVRFLNPARATTTTDDTTIGDPNGRVTTGTKPSGPDIIRQKARHPTHKGPISRRGVDTAHTHETFIRQHPAKYKRSKNNDLARSSAVEQSITSTARNAIVVLLVFKRGRK